MKPPGQRWTLNAESPDAAVLAAAAAILRAGGLVAFPTETVYGLGANALDSEACAKIFTAKGRPATNPLIVHILNEADARELAAEWPESAARLAAAFWPGPLTIVVRKNDRVPGIVSAGGPTVALRSPDHPVARGLLAACGFPLAAPSANRSQQLSPTQAEHVEKNFGDQIPILDAGPCRGGLESTVVDASGSHLRLLRPGLVHAKDLERVIGPVLIGSLDGIARSPGLMAKHYSPNTRLLLAENIAEANSMLAKLAAEGKRAKLREPADDPATEAARLYSDLHELDGEGLDCIIAVKPPADAEWTAILDRLTRAAAAAF